MRSPSHEIELPHCVEIFVPSESRYGEPLPEDLRAEVLEQVKSSLYDWFGGVTRKKNLRVEQVEGSWPLASGEMVDERVDVVYANASREALEEYFEDLPVLAAEVANRLMQEFVAFRVDSKMTLIPGDESKSPQGYKSPRVKDRMRTLQAALQRISSVRDARDLFCNVLHYEFEDEQLATVKWPDQLKACLAPGTAPRIIADQNGFKILYLQLAEDYLRKGHERQLVQRIIKDDPTLRGLVVVSDVDQKEWNLVNADIAREEGKKDRLLLRRMRVGSGQSVRTAVERLSKVDIELVGENIKAAELQQLHNEAFDVESVSKEFFNEISNWYFWALSQVEFPEDTLKDGDDEKHRATSLIRFLTRIIFCWFLKQKDLIPPSLFNEKDLTDILVDLDDDSYTYHQGILQNLFFATLNQRMGKDGKGNPYRAFAKDEGFPKNKSTYGVDTLYRYEEHFREPDKALSHFADIPFLNGGLFECLDRTEEGTNKKLYVDGFSRNKKKRARVPNHLFFAGDQTVDLSEAYGDNARRNARVRGLIRILHAYNFTVEENTPIDEEIALDPELLGKVFENLLASYNEETKTTARKQTGSFYTPRPIVEYMVDESLKAHLCGTLTTLGRTEEEAREQLDLLLGYTDEELSFYEEEIDALLKAIHTCKILDPACGSGAFPIGMLQKLVHVVQRLDPDNDVFEAVLLREAGKIEDRDERRKKIEQIGKDFLDNDVDYVRKLYLIEYCLYGVDIQPIAIQISKLRFFISLICDQNTNRDKAKNHGIRALPNLETKFVAADTLIGLPEMDQMALLDPRVNQIESEIESLYHRHFSIQRRDQKLALQRRLKELRHELGKVLSESLGSSQKAQHLSEWDPFDSQASWDFFDPHWMFGKELTDGFDIIIGNPPYISVEKFAGTPIQAKWKDVFDTYAARGDVYCFFYERGAELLREGGSLIYITSNKWMRAGYGKGLRKFLSSKVDTESVLDFGMAQNFSAATTYTCITRFYKQAPDDRIRSCYATDGRAAMADPRGYFDANFVEQPNLTEEAWVVLSKERERIKSTVEQCGIPLHKWAIYINSGIKTSHNKAFIVDSEKYESLVQLDPNSSKLLHPILRGEDVKRYHPDWKNYYVIGTFKQLRGSYNIDDYPAIKSHLEQYRRELEPRPADWKISRDGKWGGRNTQPFDYLWYEVFFSPDLECFHQPKVMYPNMTKFLPFYFDKSSNWFCNQKAFVITGEQKTLSYLTAFFNSSTFRCCFKDNFPELLGNTYELSKKYFKEIPVLDINDSYKVIFNHLIELIQFAKADDQLSAFQFLEDLIDACVMECYFREHMAERDLLFLDDLAPHLDGFDPDVSETAQRAFLEHFHKTLNARDSKICDRLDRICADSPDLLATIKEEGRV
ncbi:Eco57I restriction-modification methylase domain-containing protein [Akkermansiaceae bacterium]|nr:Eco57I restriction-modification methylase domain-containing protein [Akkermansiaceae bacterium]